MKQIVVATYPRCGSNFLCLRLISNFGFEFGSSMIKTHSTTKTGDLVVSIVRNPLESVLSIVAMESSALNKGNLDKLITKAIEEYINFYKYLTEDFIGKIYSYDALINTPDSVVYSIGKHLEIPYIDSPENISFVETKKYNYEIYTNDKKVAMVHNFIPSSTALEKYESIRDMVRKYDLSEAFRLYEIARASVEI